MPYTLKTNQISVKDPVTGEYQGVDILAEQTEQGLIAELQAEGTTQVNRITQAAADVQAAVDQAESDAAEIISDTQAAVNTLEAQKNTIAQTVASMAELGTDTTLTTTGMAADAKTAGDQLSDLNRQISDIAGENVSITSHYIETNDPPAGASLKTNNIAGATDLNLVVSSGNVLCLPYFRPNNWTANGLTFTINEDKSITVNGTATADTNYNISYYLHAPLLTRQYGGITEFGFMLSGCTDGSDTTYYLTNVNTGHKCTTVPVGIWDTDPDKTVNLVLVVKNGVQLTNKTFYPMLSLTGDEEFTSPTTPYTATVQSTAEEYTWENISFLSGYNLITGNNGTNTLTFSYLDYKTIGEVDEEIAALDERVDALEQGQWTGKKWVAFGTSLTDNYSQNSYITQGEHAGEHTGKYVPYLLNMSKLSQSAFVNRGISGGSINGHILYYIRYFTADESNADLITIEGAVNDFATSVPLGQVGDTVPYTDSLLPDSTADGTFAGACYQAFTTALTNAPNAVVVLLTETTGKDHVGYANYNQLRKNDLGLYQSDYIEMTMKVAEFVGIPVINCGRDSMINAENPQYIADHMHHTYLGGYQYARTIWAKLKGIPTKALVVPN